jgi:hypothetical protein
LNEKIVVFTIVGFISLVLILLSYGEAVAAPPSEWTTYSDHGVYFQYPSTWSISFEDINGERIITTDPTKLRGFTVNLPYEPTNFIFNQYPNLKDFANDWTSKMPIATVKEEFTDKIIGGLPAVMGKIAMGGSHMVTLAYINNNGQIFSLMYMDSPEQFNSPDSRDIEARLLSSFSFT